MTYPLCAALDIGSTTVHLLIARLADDGSLVNAHEESARPLLGARRNAEGMIPDDAAAEVLATVCHFQEVAAAYHVAQLLVVATEAVRSAPNGEDLLRRWQGVLAQPVTPLTSAQETQLAMFGAYDGVIPEAGLFADSGGASTQVAAITRGAILWQRSLLIGASGLTATHLAGDPPTPEQVEAARQAVATALASLPRPPTGAGLRPVITGGSASTLQALALPDCALGTISPACLEQAEALLVRHSSASIARRFNVPVERARVLGAGCLIVRRLVRWSGDRSWRASVAGIREGMIRAWTADPEHWLTRLPLE